MAFGDHKNLCYTILYHCVGVLVDIVPGKDINPKMCKYIVIFILFKREVTCILRSD